jgi:hypothetical protein
MKTSAYQRKRAARLFLMAVDAYGRGEPKVAQLLIQKSNACADQAAGVCNGDDQQHQQKTELSHVLYKISLANSYR